MLKTKVISWILVTMLLIGVPVMAFADFTVFDPYEHGTVTVDGDRELVHVQLDTSRMLWRRFHDGTASVTATGSVLQYSTQMRYLDNDQVNCTVLGPDFVRSDGIPTGSTISGHMNFGVNIQGLTQTYGCTGFLYLYTFSSTGSLVGSRVIYQEDYSNQSADIQYSFDYSFSTDLLRDSFYWELDFVFDFYGVANESDNATITLVNYGDDIVLDIPYSQVYQLQQQGIKSNKLLDQIDKQMAANGEKLDDIIAQGQANADKLDNMNQNIESLPGEIGDQMQDIIDNEKNEANNQGNEFVDQILDALPDPSTKVLGSLKSLTDATSYTGTDAKLQIPGIVLPAVGMLIPETELWEGTQLDMGSYMELLPGTLVTVVQSLFTIAIVLYCVYELIGLIGFCLTLRGGDS